MKPRLRDRTDRAWFSRLYDGAETERVYSYNSGARKGQGGEAYTQPRRPATHQLLRDGSLPVLCNGYHMV